MIGQELEITTLFFTHYLTHEITRFEPYVLEVRTLRA